MGEWEKHKLSHFSDKMTIYNCQTGFGKSFAVVNKFKISGGK
jgi:hypothetical protein